MLTVARHLSQAWTTPHDGVHLRMPHGAPPPEDVTPQSLRPQRELFAAVIVGDETVTLMTDHLRSWPIFYAVHGGVLHLAENAFDIAAAIPGSRVDDAEAREFLHTGFVIGAGTLWSGVSQVPSGTTVRIDRRTGDIAQSLERPLQLREPAVESTQEFTAAFDDAVDDAMQQLYNRADGRLIVLPLSAGLDSRLLATRLARDSYPAVLTYTYGLVGSAEADASREIARSLGLPWVKAEFDRVRLRSAWAEPDTSAFLRETSGGASLPHIQDWYALQSLRADGTLPAGSVVIPGHTVVSAARDSGLRHDPHVTRGQIVDTLADTHLVLRSQPHGALRLPGVHEKFLDYLGEVDLDGSPRSTMNAVRWFWQRERQAKYILNSVRAYEHFGLDWALPLHGLALWDLYEQGPDPVIESRDWYRDLIRFDYAQAIGASTPASATSPPARRSSLRAAGHTIASRTGLLKYHTRASRARAVVDHPLGFDALLAGMTRARLLAETMRGRTPLGIYAELFLRDEWAPRTRLFSNPSGASAQGGPAIRRSPR